MKQQPSGRPARRPEVGQYSCTPCSDPCWRWTLSLPIWVPGVNASAADGDISVDGSRPPSDIIDKSGTVLGQLEFAFVGAVFARKGRWGAGVDFLTASIKASADFSISDGLVSGDATGKLSASIARARVDYLYARSLAPWRFGRCGCAEHRIYVGARAYDISILANALGIATLTADIGDTWVDPIIGLDSRIPFARNWSVSIVADVGGLGLNGNFSYNVTGGVHWRFASRWGITLAYNMLDLRHEFGPKAKRRTIDLNLRGPQLAIHFYL